LLSYSSNQTTTKGVNTMTDEALAPLQYYIVGMITFIWGTRAFANSKTFDSIATWLFDRDIKRGMRDYYIKRNLPIPDELKKKSFWSK